LKRGVAVGLSGAQNVSMSLRGHPRLGRLRNPMPDFVRQVLIRCELMDAFEERAPHQHDDYLGWIARAKRSATREKRLAQMLDELAGGDRYMNMPCNAKR
jgi:epoxyqueuosine reductase QueG